MEKAGVVMDNVPNTTAGKPTGKQKILRWITTGSLLLLALITLLQYLGKNRNRVVIGSKDEVFFTGQATKEDAQKLGAALQKDGYFQDAGTSVFLDKDKDGATLSLVQKEGVWDQPEMLFSAEEVAREVAPALGGFPVRVKLMDSEQNVKKQGVAGRTPVGKDEIFYFGSATNGDAQALGKALVDDKYFQNNGASVLLSKDGRGTVLSFVVGDGAWNDAESVTGFEAIAKEVAPTIGGLPITLRMINTTLESKKELTVK